LVTVLVNDAFRIAERAYDAVEARAAGLGPEWDPGPVLDQVGLLALLAGQDVEPAEDSTDQFPRWRIARRVAPERVISTVDPEARHVRKSRAVKKDGYKVHVVAEPDTGLIVDARASSGAGPSSSDAVNGADMIAAAADGAATGNETGAGWGVEQVLGDSAYDSNEMLTRCDELGVQPVIKPRPLRTAVPGGISIDDFEVEAGGEDGARVRCPGGFTVPVTPAGQADFTAHCHRCVLRPQCTKARDGRIVRLGPAQLRARRHRAEATEPAFRTDYRRCRPMAERAIAWLVRPGRRSPYRGRAKTSAWIQRRAAAVNLKRLNNLGLTRVSGQWTLTPDPA
jgi:hypothetical protein